MQNQYETAKHAVSSVRGRASGGRRRLITVATVLGLLGLVASVTLAVLLTRTAPLVNTFEPSKVACSVIEEFDKLIKSNVHIQNTGDVQSYIRAKLVVTWMSVDGSRVTGQMPQPETDYDLVFAENTHWQLGSDGYWYYTQPVEPEGLTENLIASCQPKVGAVPPAPDFFLSVEIVASSIQAAPTEAVALWSSGVATVRAEDSTLLVNKGEATI